MSTATRTTADAESEDTETSTRKPYVVVLMSEEMKAKLVQWCKDNNTTATALLRLAGANAIGYDLAAEPQPAPRQKYTTEDQRKAAHTMASKKSGLLRKALVQSHFAAMKAKPALKDVAMATVEALANPQTLWTMDSLESLNAQLDAAIKAGK
jgi:hypothetical protein